MSSYTEVFVWGCDDNGQLGLAQQEAARSQPHPRCCSFSVLILKVSCGERHSAFVETTGLVYAVGSNEYGQLGLGRRRTDAVDAPCWVEALRGRKAVDIACGGAHTSVITSDRLMFSWGRGDSGALGTGSLATVDSPKPVPLPCDFTPTAVVCGSRHSAVLGFTPCASGLLLMCGSGEAGQLGTGKRTKELHFTPVAHPEPVKQAALGLFHTAFATVLGRVFAMGANDCGQLGIGSRKGKVYPTLVRALEGVSIEKVACGGHSAAVSCSGELFLWGSGAFGEWLSPTRLTSIAREVVDVSVGTTFGTAMDAAGVVWAWGDNASGELALGDYHARNAPTPIHSLRLKSIKSVACGGSFAMATGRDVSHRRRRSTGASETQRKAQTGPVVWDREWLESARSTARVDCDRQREAPSEKRPKPAYTEPVVNCALFDSSAPLRLKLESQVSHLSRELQDAESKLAESSEALFAEQHSRVLAETEVEALKSALAHTKAKHEQQTKQQAELIKELTQRCQSLETEVRSPKPVLPYKPAVSEESLAEAKKQCERLEVALETATKESESHKSQYEESQARLSRLQRDYAMLQCALDKAEQHNAELLAALDRNSLSRARDYREKSMNMLGTPSPTRSSITMTEKSLLAVQSSTGAVDSSREERVLRESDSNRPPTFRAVKEEGLAERLRRFRIERKPPEADETV